MKILITTGIYPPKIGGPAQYAKNLKEEFQSSGHSVVVKTFTIEDHLPTGIRHLFFFFKIIPAVFFSDVVVMLDTFSVGFPTIWACLLLGKKSIVRTGGDFLWEGYVERTGKKVLLRNFYQTELHLLNVQEKVIFRLTRFVLKHVSVVVFSTPWQRDIFLTPYQLNVEKIRIVENYYGSKEPTLASYSKLFAASTRKLVWKNLDILNAAFDAVKVDHPEIQLFTKNLPYGQFMDTMKTSYAVILVSLGDISPNMILDSIRFNRPFICTREVGLYDRIKNVGIFVDPLNEAEVESAIRNLLDEQNHMVAQKKVEAFTFSHTWKDIAFEFLTIIKAM